MRKVLCLEDRKEYYFDAISGYDAIQRMLYTLNIAHEDRNAKTDLCNNRTWCLTHAGKTYACTL